MAPKHKQEAAAHAHAGHYTNGQPFSESGSAETAEFHQNPDPFELIMVEDSDSECNYTGGVNVDSESDEDYGPSDDEWSEAETIEELEGDELEANLEELLAEATQLEAAKYVQITAWKSKKDWRKAECNWSLGYSGNSWQTQQRNEKRQGI